MEKWPRLTKDFLSQRESNNKMNRSVLCKQSPLGCLFNPLLSPKKRENIDLPPPIHHFYKEEGLAWLCDLLHTQQPLYKRVAEATITSWSRLPRYPPLPRQHGQELLPACPLLTSTLSLSLAPLLISQKSGGVISVSHHISGHCRWKHCPYRKYDRERARVLSKLSIYMYKGSF